MGVPVKPMIGRVRQPGHQVIAEVAARRTVRLVHQDVRCSFVSLMFAGMP